MAEEMRANGGMQGIMLEPGAGRSLWVLGDLYTYKLSADDTAGASCVMEVTVFPQSGVPPHIHHAEDETFYVLAGDFSFLCGESTFPARAGSFIHVPKGTPHAFQNVGEEPGRFLVIFSPSGFEKLLEAIGEVATDTTSRPPVDPATIDKLMAIAPEHHLEILPPPAP